MGTKLLAQKICICQVLCRTSGSSLGYGFGTMDDDDEVADFPQTPALPITEAVA